eukprot:TRINITY_DN59540_c0_g1_i1.p1 TRINITY_DN59540_c0_g1~~TRINITY_DN59540_c0_g1_i1.p1  ORF type:complete len:461 (+),score=107.97 TRINITY_DN59540_c0_g1_i1:141-1523(+)
MAPTEEAAFFSKWTVNEEKRKTRPPRRLSASSSAAALLQSQSAGSHRGGAARGRTGLLSNCGSTCVSRGSTADSHASSTDLPDALAIEDGSVTSTKSDAGYATFKARFAKEYAQQQRVNNLAVNRRQKLVARTLEVMHDFDPTAGLAGAAAALEAEAQSSLRHRDEQVASCSSLAQPRLMPEVPKEPEVHCAHRSWSEQQARAKELAEPRPLLQPEPWETATPAHGTVRSASEQQRWCAALAQPKAPPAGEEPPRTVAAWREELVARASVLVPAEVQAAQHLLDRMRSRPRSAQRRVVRAQCTSKAEGAEAAGEEGVSETLAELRSVVEEVLWVALLQVRSCPKGPSSGVTGNMAPQTSNLEERLGSLLISTVGPALRPVARRVLGPGQNLARRIRSEFPKLARHLGFRDSEDMEPVPTAWKAEELQVSLASVRESRDTLLAMDLTKDALVRLGEAGTTL